MMSNLVGDAYHLMMGEPKETPSARIVELCSTEPEHMSDALHMGSGAGIR
jgi:hypothetical protein